ncbi:hypothetical protein BLOT_015502 [Blomia tropicalis]|nr:hypothetical protein BLOT_015502 [Blomia tropicalis]
MLFNEDEDSSDNSKPTNNKENDQLSKRNCFNMFPALFRRKSTTTRPRSANNCSRTHGIIRNGNHYRSTEMLTHNYNDESTYHNLCNTNTSPIFPITDSCLIPGSPISPHVKNFNSDMRQLAISRADNPYISEQMERSNSTTSDYLTADYGHSSTTPILSLRRNHNYNYFTHKRPSLTELCFEQTTDDDDELECLNNGYGNEENSHNLHDKLIRSPPPNFPDNINQFLFTDLEQQ